MNYRTDFHEKPGWRTGLGPEKTPLTFGADVEKRTDTGSLFSLSPISQGIYLSALN